MNKRGWIGLLGLLPWAVFAQPEVLARLDQLKDPPVARMIGSAGACFVFASEPFVIWTDFASGQSAIRLQGLHVAGSASFEGGLALLSSRLVDPNTAQYQLHLMDPEGEIRSLPPFPPSYSYPVLAAAGGRIFLAFSTADTAHAIFSIAPGEDDLRLDGTLPVPIRSLMPWGSRLLVWAGPVRQVSPYRLDASGIAALATMQVQFYDLIGQSDSHLYIKIFNNSAYHIWRTDLTAAGSGIFLTPANHEVTRISFQGDRFFLTQGGIRAGEIGYAANPQGRKLIALAASERKQFIPTITGAAPPLYFAAGTHDRGMELFRINAADSLERIADLAPGPISSVQPYNLRTATDSLGRLYLPMTNGGDAFQYIYRLENGSLQSLARLEPGSWLKALYLQGGHVYWETYDYGEDEHILGRVPLGGPFEVQPPPEARDTWYREMTITGNRFQTNNPNLHLNHQRLAVDPLGGVVTAVSVEGAYFGQTPEEPFYCITSHAPPRPVHQSEIITKYHASGDLLWQQILGGRQTNRYHGITMTVDSAGDVIVFGRYEDVAYLRPDSLTLAGRANFLAKLNGATGKFKWYRNLHDQPQTMGEGGPLQVDRAGNIYVPFTVPGFFGRLDEVELFADRSPYNALACYSPDGQLRWAKPIPTPWTDQYAAANHLWVDVEREQIAAAHTQGAYNVWGPCESGISRHFIQVLTLGGEVIDTLGFSGSSLSAVTAGTLLENGDLLAFGFHRGTLTAGPLKGTSPVENRCPRNEGFALNINRVYLQPDRIALSPAPAYYPLAATREADTVYVLAARNNELELLRMDKALKVTGRLPLGQHYDPFDGWLSRIDLIVRNGYIYLPTLNAGVHPESGIFPHLIQSDFRIGVMKRANAGWIPVTTPWELDTAPLPGRAPDLWVYPNPFSGSELTLEMHQNASGYQTAELIDMGGRIISRHALDGNAVQQLVLPETIAAGVYVLRISGSKGFLAAKLVVTN